MSKLLLAISAVVLAFSLQACSNTATNVGASNGSGSVFIGSGIAF